MRHAIIATLLSACVLALTTFYSNAAHYGLQSSTTSFDFWWYSDSALATFLQSPHPGVTMITPGNYNDPEDSTIKAKGYAIMGGLGGGAAEQAQTNLAGGLANVEQAIDNTAAEGATYIYVDEPWPAPGQSTATSAASIAYNVKGFNIIYNYIHSKHPGVQFGLTIGDDGGAALHLSMLRAGLEEDFASAEYYNSCCTTTNPFVAQKAQFPNVKTMIFCVSHRIFVSVKRDRHWSLDTNERRRHLGLLGP